MCNNQGEISDTQKKETHQMTYTLTMFTGPEGNTAHTAKIADTTRDLIQHLEQYGTIADDTRDALEAGEVVYIGDGCEARITGPTR